ncbi:MAG: hypothetical protein KKA55_11175 [Proteobacteria bacterium]|nr:hypothetical protein [Pseudomonadota bacterium]MBU1596081.1 hypothetical protein [Pseudomonadota bacterium]
MTARFVVILALFAVFAAVSAAPSVAAETKKPDTVHGKFYELPGIPPEKRPVAKKLYEDYQKAVEPIQKDYHAKAAELDAQLSKGASGEAVAELTRSLGELDGKLLQEKAALRAKLLKETGVYVPLWHKKHPHKAML